MSSLNLPADPRVVVGIDTADDAGAYALDGTDQVLIQTLDIITPVCDDPYLFGRVAAANSLSDVYAMGGKPVTGLNICFFPEKGPGPEQYKEILRGGLDTLTKAGAALMGGQTVKNDELKYGISVTGIATRDQLTPNSGARHGDRLILTKPIGTGVLIGESRAGRLDEHVLRDAAEIMATLNDVAAEVMREFGCKGATDITGFGLSGHAWEVAAASNVRLVFDSGLVPVYADAVSALQRKLKMGTIKPEVKWPPGTFETEDGVEPELKHLFIDPQTSGGLLIAVAEDKAEIMLKTLLDRGVKDAALVGRVELAEQPAVVFAA